jgi:perosamine synthetase
MHFIPISKPSITEREELLISEAVKSGWVSSLGSFIDEFEKKFADYCQTQYGIATSNGTTALHLALLALNIKENDEIIVPDFSFIATANAIAYTGAKPIFVDIDENTLCIDPTAIVNSITPRTKAIIAVHIYGHPANMPEINRIAKEHNLYVIEDAAEAHGAEVNNRRVGSLSDIAIFSFYGNKIITTGEGGFVATNNEQLYNRARFLKDHAMNKTKRYWHDEVGYNYRMTNIQAALGCAQLERIDQIIEKKKKIFDVYQSRLKNVSGLKINHTEKWAKNVYWMICAEFLTLNEDQRDSIMKQLKNNGIDSRPYFYPMSDMPMYEAANTPIAHKISKIGINLPSFFDITDEEIYYVCDKLKETFARMNT